MSEVLTMFEAFMADEKAWDMYITGSAGTGKTTSLHELVAYCEENDIATLTTAFTHKACGILANKLPDKAAISTLHSFLRKRPAINDQATRVKDIQLSKQQGKPQVFNVLFLDEYSMVGEKDWADLQAVQDPNYTGIPLMKVVYIGDPNQLPPVGDTPVVHLKDPYWVKLTKVHRQAEDNPLMIPLNQLVSFIEGTAEPTTLIESDSFIRGQDLYDAWSERETTDTVLLAYTNKRVQELNEAIAERCEPEAEDILFSPTTRSTYGYFNGITPDKVRNIVQPWNGLLEFNSKYRTLEFLVSMEGIKFADVFNYEEDEAQTVAYVFGHYDYKLKLEELGHIAAETNKIIDESFHCSPAAWARSNARHPLARARSKAWREYLTFKDSVICLDFPYAMTVHKSQGSTYDTVILDSQDLAKCSEHNYTLYLKLMYVAISRASNKVITN